MAGIHMSEQSSDSYSPRHLFAGQSEIITGAFIVAAGITLAANSILAFNGSDELVEWVPGAGDSTGKALFVSAEAIDTTGGAASQPVYKGAYFNTDALNWPSGTTDAQKLHAFEGTQISHRKIGYSG